jgi:hypothetical protein
MAEKLRGPRGREYRVVWKRVGQPRRRRIYQTRAGADALLDLLRNSHPDEPPAEVGHVVGETGVDWSESELEQWERMSAPFEEEPTRESREVSEWVGADG